MTFIYAIGTKSDLQKIGYSDNPEKRLKQLQTGNPEQLYLHHTISIVSSRARLVEQFIHSQINYKRTKGEWFRMSPEEAKSILTFAEIRWAEDPLL